jgi:hypothetical protein
LFCQSRCIPVACLNHHDYYPPPIVYDVPFSGCGQFCRWQQVGDQ